MSLRRLPAGIIIGLSFLMSPIALNAGIVNISHEIIKGEQDSYDVVQDVPNRYNLWNNGKVRFSFSLEEQHTVIDSAVLKLYTVGGEERLIENIDIPGGWTTDPLEQGEYYAKLIYYYKVQEDDIVEDSVESCHYVVWPRPSVSSQSDWDAVTNVIWSSTPNVLAVNPSGGTSSWKYFWYFEDSPSEILCESEEGPSSWSIPSGEDGISGVIVCDVVNYAPDGVTEWLSSSLRHEYTIWRDPSSAGNISEISACRGYERPLSVTVSGGSPSHWSYQWYKGDVSPSSVCEGATGMSYLPECDTEESTTAYYAVVRNTPEGMSPSYCYGDTIPFSVHSYPRPSVTLSDMNETLSVWSGASQEYRVSVSGNTGDQWSYGWLLNGVSVPGASAVTYTYSGQNTGESGITDTVSVVAVCRNPVVFGDSLYRDTLSGYVRVWPVAVSSSCIEYSGVSYKERTSIDVCARYPDPVVMSVLPSGGDSSSWLYEWQKDGSPIGESGSSLELDIALYSDITEKVTINYTVNVHNSPDGISQPYGERYEFSVTVWPRPGSFIKEDRVYRYIGQGSISVDSLVYGGYKDGWLFIDVSTGDSLKTYVAEVENDYKRTELRLVNINADGTVWYDSDNDFKLFFDGYPQVDISIEGFNNVFYGESVSYDVSNNGYKYGRWEYLLEDGQGKPIKSGSGSDFKGQIYIPDISAESQSITYQLYCKCYLEDGFPLFDKRYDYTITAYRKHAARISPNVPRDFYYGEELLLEVDIDGGDDKDWRFVWLDENKRTIHLGDKTFNGGKVTIQNQDPIEKTYYVATKYAPDGNCVLYDTIEYVVKEYSKVIMLEIVPYESNIRENVFVSMSATLPKYGNPDGWYYQWDGGKTDHLDFVKNDTLLYESFEELDDNAIGKYVGSSHHQLVIWNESPNGKKWYNQEIEFGFFVHKRPNKPELVVKGGSGNSSGVYVVKGLLLPDSELQEYGYYFEYGDATSDVLQTTNRVFKYKGSCDMTDIWARSVFIYDDGFVCCSDKSYAILGNHELSSDNKINIDGPHFDAILSTPAPAVVSVFTLDGSVIKVYTYPESTVFDETLDFSELNGLYLIRYIIGQLREERKFLIKE